MSSDEESFEDDIIREIQEVEERFPNLKIEDQSPWAFLPDLIMEKVFSYLTMRQKYIASMVCKPWYQAFHLPRAWGTFVFEEKTLSRRRYNYYTGWQHFLDHLRTQLCLAAIGPHFRHLIFAPIYNFHNMYEFMKEYSYYAEMQGRDKYTVQGIGEKVTSLSYLFPCDQSYGVQTANQRLYGTGGKLLAAVKRLMINLPNLRHLNLIDLMLDTKEALTLLDEICWACCETLESLRLINSSRTSCEIIHCGVFLNLRLLAISPHNIGDDLLYLLSCLPNFEHLHLLQNKYTLCTGIKSIGPKQWINLKEKNKKIRVHLSMESPNQSDKTLVWQEKAPVATVFTESPYTRLDSESLTRILDWYRNTLRIFGYTMLPKFRQPKSFQDRLDPLILMLVKECPFLTTLILRERISTATLLLIAEHGYNLRWFYVRRKAVILKCDWPKNPDWNNNFYKWFQKTSKSYEATEKAIAKKLNNINWKMLTDKEFKDITINMYLD